MRADVVVVVACATLMTAALGEAGEPPRFDYVVVGAGAAGSVVANRLTENPNVSVLVLEAGGPDTDPRIHQPSEFRQLLGSAYDWAFETQPEPELAERRIPWPRGRGWGGSGSLAAMVYVRGHARDFDRWEALGNPGWGYDDVLPYFKKAENQERGPSRYHGVGGPHNVADPRWLSPISKAFVEAGVQAGLERNDDFNGARQAGVGFFQLNQKNGERHSAADAYLRPVLHRANLRIENHARVTRILFEGRRAVGVRYRQAGAPYDVRAEREVILSAGAIGSPQLLMLSGVGPASHLEALGLPVLHDLPGVGENLQDHPRVAVSYASRVELGFASEAQRRSAEREYFRGRTGPLASNGVGAGAFVRLDPEAPAPEIKLFLTANPPAGSFSVHAALMHPVSRGHIRLASGDPEQPPAIHANYLDAAADLDSLAAGLALARRIAEAEALGAYRGDELAPGPDAWAPETLREYVRENATTFFHAVGTCRMGDDALAVVDASLRVRGLEGLRVIDASVVPTLISGATHAATVMIGEKGADLVKGDW